MDNYDAPHLPVAKQRLALLLTILVQLYRRLAMSSLLQPILARTINDRPNMRRLIDCFEGKTVPIKYTIGVGEPVARPERICRVPCCECSTRT